ncbi:MAG: non-homologous end-joining DNA ligase [Pseudonocardia sp.]|nr:non-homologous end-joining DNA ligase [Pseudonocardia sp.]
MTRHAPEISRPDKVLYPDPGYTKKDLANYYEWAAELMLPHLAGRPLVMRRFPDGIDGSGFYQKQAPDDGPDFLHTLTVAADNERGEVRHLLVDDVDTLRYLANQACLELHRWLSRSTRLDNPDLLIIDLDPPSAPDLAALRRAARAAHELFENIGLVPFLMATGGSGYHVVAPLDGAAGFDDVRALAREIAARLCGAAPDELTTEQRKANRGDRIFLDTNRNAYAQTAITPYSPRARPGAPVATPIEFAELGKIEPSGFGLRGIRNRMAHKRDPWRHIHDHARPTATARKRLDQA